MAKRDLIFLLPLLLAACGEPVSKYERDDPVAAPAPEPAALPPVQPAAAAPVLAWTHVSHDDGAALVLQEDGKDVLRLTCVRGEGLTVHANRFKPVDSEERMTVGAGDVAVTLVATADATRNPPAVKATGPLEPAFLAAVENGQKIAANHGAQDAGPFDAPPPAIARAFVTGCRGEGG